MSFSDVQAIRNVGIQRTHRCLMFTRIDLVFSKPSLFLCKKMNILVARITIERNIESLKTIREEAL